MRVVMPDVGRQRNTINASKCRNSQYRQEMTTGRSFHQPAQRHRIQFPAPTRIEADQERGCFQSFGQAAEREADEVGVEPRLRLAREQRCVGAAEVGGEPLRELGAGGTLSCERGGKLGQQRRRLAVCGGVVCDIRARVTRTTLP